MDGLCADEFWDWNLTWGNHVEYPQFTRCFQDTMLLWIPILWLLVTSPIYLYILLQYKTAASPYSWKYITKMSVTILQLSFRYLQVAQTYSEEELRCIGLAAEGGTLLLVMLYTEIERRKGFVTSGILTIYWFLSIVCWSIQIYSNLIKQEYGVDSDDLGLTKTYLVLLVAQFALVCLADCHKVPESARECKLASSSFVSRCLFLWFDGFMNLGYKRPLEAGDISAIMPNDQPGNAVPRFEQTWKKEKEQLAKKHKTTEKKENVSLFKIMVKANWPDLLAANLLNLMAIAILLSRPLVTGLLVRFAGDPGQPMWKGYVFVLAGVLCILGDGLICSYVHHLCCSISLRLNQCLKSAVFKKALKLTNKARSKSSVGEIVNILGENVGQVQHFVAYFFWIWSEPVKVVGNLLILYSTLDFAALAGVSVLAFVMPLNIYFARQGHSTHLKRRDKKDERIKLMTEILNGIKILKLYAWEMVYGDKILDLRNEEIAILRKQRVFRVIGSICWTLAPYLMSLVTFAVYIQLNVDHMLTAETAFRAWATFGMLTGTFNALPHIGQHLLRSVAALRKVEAFLNSEEISEDIVAHERSDMAITIKDGTFTWDENLGPCLKNINISVPRGSLVAVVGSVGSGKSSLLSAILGSMERDEGYVNVDGSVAYVPQQAWIQNCTLKDNILFGQAFREQIYNDVIDACSLRRDLDILPGKDLTEIGEKGINLSGGQKQRISTARAVYFNADIYLLDDPLSAVDAHVGKAIFDHVISDEGLLRNKTRVLVTHGITWLPRVDKIFVLEDGEVSEAGTYQELMTNQGAFAKFIQKYNQEDNSNEDQEDTIEVFQPERPNREEEEDADSKLLDELIDSVDRNAPPSCSQVVFNRLLSDSGYTSDSDSKQRAQHSKQDASAPRKFVRSISRAISVEDKAQRESLKKLIRMDTFDDKQKMNEERVKRESDKHDKGKLMEDEELETGKVHFKYIVPYFKAVGILQCVLILVFFTVYKFSEIAQNLTLKEWTGDRSLNNLTSMPGDSLLRHDRNYFYIKIYMLVGICFGLSSMINTISIGYSVLKASRVLHEKMLKNILRGPMAFFDTTPVGRITNRFSNDIEPLDGAISDHTEGMLHCIFGLVSVFVVIMSSLPNFILMAIPTFFAYHEIQKRFVPVRRQLSRMESKKRSPVYSHFTETLNGVQVLRAFDMQEKFADQNAVKVKELCETIFYNRTVDRWMDMRLALLNAFCFSATIYFAIQEREYIGSAAVGMVITFVLQLNDRLEWFVRLSGEIEKDVVCIERIGEYSSTKQEAPLHTSVVPRKSWPDSGKVDIVDYSVRYRDGLDLVLKNINVSVNPGEKVGIVGRTGAGKSSLTLALFRLIEPAEGSIHIDAEDISKLGLFDLRSSLTILPQEPILFSGTLRTNLDPLNAHTDDEVFTALDHAHLKTFVDTLPGKLTYDCGEGGQNLSVGQRQLICLARSLLRKSSVLILDEATAAVDMKTDELIQNTIKTEFRECTVLTIAHRLNTIIDYDRILVLDHGEVKEFDSPKKLMEDRNSAFHSMAKDAGLVK